nr:hypothetical protein CFP56_72221 [Quercus suber]
MGPNKSEILAHFTLFSLKERARSSLKSLLSNPRVHTVKGRKGPAARRKLLSTLSSSLPLILTGPTTRKGKPFHARVILCLFSLKNHKLVNRFYFGAKGALVEFWKKLVLVLLYRSQINNFDV